MNDLIIHNLSIPQPIRYISTLTDQKHSGERGIKLSLFLYKNVLRLISIAILCIYSSVMLAFQPTFTLMLDPAGDAQYPGRIIDDSFERGITLQCVEELQRVIRQTLSKRARRINPLSR